MISTVTLGVPLEVDFGTTDLIKSFARFTWRTGFPITMPRGFMQKAQDFYNNIRLRVNNASVEAVHRKPLAGLKVDLDDIVDAIVDQVRQSPDGLYTNYLETRVHNSSLEDACYDVGVQLKAYGVDLTNYRNIAGAVLGVPLMPTVASTVIGVANLAPSLKSVSNMTTNLVSNPVVQLPGVAMNAVSHVSGSAVNTLDSIRSNLVANVPGRILSPLSLFQDGLLPASSNQQQRPL